MITLNTFTRFASVRFPLFVLLFAAAGCSIPVVNPGPLSAVEPASSAPRAGNVYLVRGWLGIFSTGIDTLGDKLRAVGIHDAVYQEAQWRDLAATIIEKYKGVRNPEPLVLVGHSYGADDIVSIAREVGKAGITVDLLITIDPTTPPPVPANVRYCYNLYQSGLLDMFPVTRGIPLHADPNFKGKLQNVNIRVDRTDLLDPDVNHFNIEKKDKIHQEAIKKILAVCPPRPTWALTQRGGAPIMASQSQPPAKNTPARALRPTASIGSDMISTEP
jgi:hypothetical protein